MITYFDSGLTLSIHTIDQYGMAPLWIQNRLHV